MKLTRRQRSFLLLGMVIAVAALPLLGAFHHHHGDAGGACWFCTTATAAALPLLLVVFPRPEAPLPFVPLGINAPSWFLWMACHRRGPPLSA